MMATIPIIHRHAFWRGAEAAEAVPAGVGRLGRLPDVGDDVALLVGESWRSENFGMFCGPVSMAV